MPVRCRGDVFRAARKNPRLRTMEQKAAPLLTERQQIKAMNHCKHCGIYVLGGDVCISCAAGSFALHCLVIGLTTQEKDALLELLILGVRDMEALMVASRGVCGLFTLSRDDAEWSSLVSGGKFEDWLHRWNQGVVAINDAEERMSDNESEP